MDGLCAGWCVDYDLGRVVSLGFIPKYGVDVGMVVCTVLLYVVIYCMFTVSLCCVFISLCRDAFVYGSAILTLVMGAPNLCGRCSNSAEDKVCGLVLYLCWLGNVCNVLGDGAMVGFSGRSLRGCQR